MATRLQMNIIGLHIFVHASEICLLTGVFGDTGSYGKIAR